MCLFNELVTGIPSIVTFDVVDCMPCSSGRDLILRENADDSDIFKPNSSIKETMDNHAKHSNSQISLGQHHYNLSRSMFLKRSRHHYANQYSRRNSHNYHKPCTSFGKSSPFYDERLCLKLGSRYNTELSHHPDFTEFREKASCRPERIRSSSSVIDGVLPDGVKMICGLCHESLRRKPHTFGGTLASDELSIVAVLVCSHIYHADCLEQKTSLEHKRDPPCPLCSDLTYEPDLA